MDYYKAEYIWIDGSEPTSRLRSKGKVVPMGEEPPIWGFDGSSTNQAPGENSDCVLRPVFTCPDPIRGGDNVLAMCEVLLPDMSAHPSNTRAACAEAAEKYADFDTWFGNEQEYTFFDGIKPLGWPDNGFPAPQGGINGEVMPAQWEFQLGPLGAPEVADQLWVARWLLYRIGEDIPIGDGRIGISAKLDPKPVQGDWNGAGAHANFSTRQMREDYDACVAAAEALKGNHDEHIANYGHRIEERLTGLHETCSYREFRYGVSDRGASVRIPWQVHRDGKGYIEDRRPNANCDPYKVTGLILNTVCGAAS
ncbi:Glutamine synthetase [Geodia barretti]|uniref:glutamine synthetase n=1 Tax=Geodia barretti TaxID=519541 RepID=A0AA35W960_GEOBA|nr:Glutamine synthetase [Geodia barretti]